MRLEPEPFERPLSSSVATMISDGELYNIALLLGATSMVLIVVYHYVEVNAADRELLSEKSQSAKAS